MLIFKRQYLDDDLADMQLISKYNKQNCFLIVNPLLIFIANMHVLFI